MDARTPIGIALCIHTYRAGLSWYIRYKESAHLICMSRGDREHYRGQVQRQTIVVARHRVVGR